MLETKAQLPLSKYVYLVILISLNFLYRKVLNTSPGLISTHFDPKKKRAYILMTFQI